MQNKLGNKTKILTLLVLVILSFFGAWVYISKYSQRSRATNPAVNFTFSSASGNQPLGEERNLTVIVTPDDAANKISGIDLTINTSGIVELLNVFAPVNTANENGTMFTEILHNVSATQARIAYTAGVSDDRLPNSIKFTITFKSDTAGSGSISINANSAQVVGNISGNKYNINPFSANSFTFSDTASTTPTPPTPTLTCELNGGKCGALTVNGVICPSGYEQGGSGTCAVGTGCCKPILTPTATPIPPTATPPSGRENYIIDIGTKQSLVINIDPSVAPLIKFKAKLASLMNFPDMYLRMRVRDEFATVNNPAQSAEDACNNPPPSDKDFLIPVHATDKVYSAVSLISGSAPNIPGVTVATVSPDGWVTLDGVLPGKYYTIYLKGPKTRKGRMLQHVLLQPNQINTQDFDWTETPLDPGDLPDPNNRGEQDCTINSTDWSLEKARIGSTDGSSLDVCDVNYDGICNAGDSVAILDTLSKRPDDDL